MNLLLLHNKWCFYANVYGIGFSISLWSRTHQEPHSNKYIIVCFCSTSSSPPLFFHFPCFFQCMCLLVVHNNLQSYLGCMLLLKYSRILWFYFETQKHTHGRRKREIVGMEKSTTRNDDEESARAEKKRYNQRVFFVLVCFIFPLGFVFFFITSKWNCVYVNVFVAAASIVCLLSFIASNIVLWPHALYTQLNPKRVEHKCFKSSTTMMNCLLMVLHFLGSTNVVRLSVCRYVQPDVIRTNTSLWLWSWLLPKRLFHTHKYTEKKKQPKKRKKST